MKERNPQVNLLPKERAEEIIAQLGCNPNSIRFLRKPEGSRFSLILEAEKEGVPKVIKLAGDRRNISRLQIESHVLSVLPRDYLKQNGVFLPKIEKEFTQFGNLAVIMISKIPEGRKTSTVDFLHLLDVFRQMKLSPDIGIQKVRPEDYLKNFLIRLRFLQSAGVIVGISQQERERLKQFYLENWRSLLPFDSVFVHGDLKKKHVRKVDENLVVIDFDKSVIGNELEDSAWLSVRHPDLERAIKTHLRNLFSEQKEKLKHFEKAFHLMQIDRLLEAYFTRTYQWRGYSDAFSYASKIWGRVNLLLKTA